MKRAVSRFAEACLLPYSPVGRSRIRPNILLRIWPILFPIAFLYRRTLIRSTHITVIIGSLGKTTTSHAVAASLGLSTAWMEGWNSQGFLALALLRIPRSQRFAVIEVGAKFPGCMRRYRRLINPDAAVITSIATEHHSHLGSLESIREEKADMIRDLPESAVIIANGDDSNVLWMASLSRARVVTYGFGRSNDIRADAYHADGFNGGRIDVRLNGLCIPIESRLIGRHLMYPLMAGLAVGVEAGKDFSEITFRLAKLPPVAHRLSPVPLRTGDYCVMDDYKSTYETVFPALDALETLPASHRVVIMGEVFEPPVSDETAYSIIGQRIAAVADQLIFVGVPERYTFLREGAMRGGFSDAQIRYARESVHQASDFAQQTLKGDSVILIKGFGCQRLQRIPLLLDGENVRCTRSSCKMLMTVLCKDCRLL